MTRCFADRLLDAIQTKGAPTVVNIDPVYARLPDAFKGPEEPDTEVALEAIVTFAKRVIHIVAPLVPVVKINSAYFERYYADGVDAYYRLVREASQLGLIVIGDAKRGDVGHTAEMYAEAHLATPNIVGAEDDALVSPDALTINGYFGFDGVKPFADIAKDQGKGVFVLVRTSNPSAATIQDVVTTNGLRVCEVVAGEVARWARESGTIGEHGYSSIGAVVATRDAQDAAKLRSAMPDSIFLVPGYGAQGGAAEHFKPYFKSDGTGAIIAAGRSVIFAHQQEKYRRQFDSDWEKCIQQSCKDFVADIRRIASES